MPRIDGIYESVLYTDDIAAATAFYTDVIGLRAIDPPDEHSAAFRLEDRSLLSGIVTLAPSDDSPL